MRDPDGTPANILETSFLGICCSLNILLSFGTPSFGEVQDCGISYQSTSFPNTTTYNISRKTSTDISIPQGPLKLIECDSVYPFVPGLHLKKNRISTVHAWIKCLECCLHISYRLLIKKWLVTHERDKQIVKEGKEEIITKLRQKLLLLVDIPKQGFATTNDGNTARKCFRQYGVTASITVFLWIGLYNVFTFYLKLHSYKCASVRAGVEEIISMPNPLSSLPENSLETTTV